TLSRASLAGAEDLNAQVNNYRGNNIGSGVADLVRIKSITYNNITNRLKGEEVADYSQNYNSAGTITSTATNYYMVGTTLSRASLAGAEDLNAQVNNYRGNNIGSGVADLVSIK